MNQRKIIAGLIVSVLVIGLMECVYADDRGDIQIWKVSIEPDKIYSGQKHVKITVFLRNIDNEDTIANVDLRLTSMTQKIDVTSSDYSFDKIEPLGMAEAVFYCDVGDAEPRIYDLKLCKAVNNRWDKGYIIALPISGKPILKLSETTALEGKGGDLITGSFNVTNVGDYLARDISIGFLPAYPVTTGQNTFDLGNLGEKETKSFTVKFYVDEDALAGRYQIPVRVKWYVDGAPEEKRILFTLNVVEIPVLIIASIETDPIEVSPGDENVKIYAALENLEGSNARNVVVRIDDRIFMPSGANTNLDFLGDIGVGFMKKAEFKIDVSKNASFGFHPIKINVSFLDRYGVRREDQVTQYLFIEKKPDLEIVYVESVDKLRLGWESRIQVQVRNNGAESAKFVWIELDPMWPFSTDRKADFLGELRPNEIKTAFLNVEVNPIADVKNYGLDIKIRYRDQEDNEYVEKDAVSLMVYERDIEKEIWELVCKYYSKYHRPIFILLILLIIPILFSKRNRILRLIKR